MDLVLNELSLHTNATSVHEAKEHLDTLVHVLIAAFSLGVNSTIRGTEEAYLAEVAPSYSLSSWLGDGSVDREMRRVVRSALTKGPIIDPSPSLQDVCIGGQLAQGGRFAFETTLPLVSLNVAPWNVDPLPATVCTLQESGELREESHDFVNLHDTASLASRTHWIRMVLQRELTSGPELVQRAAELLPKLEIVQNAEDQLLDLRGNEQNFLDIVAHLFALNDRAVEWQAGVGATFTEGYRFSCSGESESTLNSYSAERTFLCRDGTSELFEWHSKINSLGWRIHFRTTTRADVVQIGYVGPHLRVSSG